MKLSRLSRSQIGAKPVRLLAWFLAMSALALGVGALTLSIVAQKFSPPLALAILPNSATANEKMVALTLARDGMQADPKVLMHFASRSFTQQGLNAPAFRDAGIAMMLAGDNDAARRFFRLAEKASKRESAPNLWLFEDAFRRGDIKGGLLLLDRALRVEEGVQQKVFPLLVNVISQPEAADEIAPFLASGPDWASNFAAFAIAADNGALVLAKFIIQHAEATTILEPSRQRALVRKLIDTGEHDTAATLYAQLARVSKQTNGAGGPFHIIQGWPPFDWDLGKGGSLSTYPGEGGALDITITGGGEHQLARRLLRLSPRGYSLTTAISAPISREETLELTLSCADSSEVLLNLSLPAGQEIKRGVRVPESCMLQWIELRARGFTGRKTFSVKPIKIAPA